MDLVFNLNTNIFLPHYIYTFKITHITKVYNFSIIEHVFTINIILLILIYHYIYT